MHRGTERHFFKYCNTLYCLLVPGRENLCPFFSFLHILHSLTRISIYKMKRHRSKEEARLWDQPNMSDPFWLVSLFCL